MQGFTIFVFFISLDFDPNSIFQAFFNGPGFGGFSFGGPGGELAKDVEMKHKAWIRVNWIFEVSWLSSWTLSFLGPIARSSKKFIP